MVLLRKIKAIIRKLRNKLPNELYEPSPEWKRLQDYLQKSQRIIDLGCGANPHPRAIVGVDAFLAPVQRSLGYGQWIDIKNFKKRRIEFILANLTNLPFRDKSFDFAYAHHVFEHLDDPVGACKEMCRIARAGVIITPSIFAELAFGRPYHRWMVAARGHTIIFIEKTKAEDRPFGEHPIPKPGGGYRVTHETNPFDILLNEGNWYHGREKMPRLSRLLRRYWYSHSPVMEVIFLWENDFNCVVVHRDGRINYERIQ